jgi:hypothetical protein
MIVFETLLSHFLLIELKRFNTILSEVTNEFFLQKISTCVFLKYSAKTLATEKHLPAIRSGNSAGSMPSTVFTDTWKAVAVKAYCALVSSFGRNNLSPQVFAQFLELKMEIWWQICQSDI